MERKGAIPDYDEQIHARTRINNGRQPDLKRKGRKIEP